VQTMNRRDFVSLLAASLASRGLAGADTEIPIILSPHASSLEQLAARELARYLPEIFSGCRLKVSSGAPEGRLFLRLGTVQNLPQLASYVSPSDLAQPDSYVVTVAREGDASVGIIAGADPRATLYAVYALLERLGCGFYLSYDARPDPQSAEISLNGWSLRDAPLVTERILFNWHNFLSGCSGWSLPDWQHWIDQAAKMRFSSIMVHAYGNNPMFSFTHNGQTKPTGFLTSTIRGRDWGAQHVNDVRRVWGGEGLFQDPVLGSSAALVPEDKAVEAATELMKQAFAYAHSRGLNVDFALDVDTHSANPQNIIATLPPGARFQTGKYLLANPDTREGQAYYQSQVSQLVGNYPEIDRIVLWFREADSPWSPWRDLPLADFPTPWKAEYQQALQKFPGLAQDKQAPGMFALSKVAKAFRRALDGIGKNSVELALGSWEFSYLHVADAFMSPEISVISIHQWNTLGKHDILRSIRAVSFRRKVTVIPYAQDDDGAYAGRPYTPPAKFASWLEQGGCAGCGILHWTTRPLDLYHKSLSMQVWKSSRDEPLQQTCEEMAERAFGKADGGAGAKYLLHWVTEAPLFGRETTDLFMDRPLPDVEGTLARSRQRREILDSMSAASLPRDGAKWVAYYRDWEDFVDAFFRSHSAWERSVKARKAGDIDRAREELAQSKPEQVLEMYARMAARPGITSGEQGLLVSMNLRWLPYIVSQRQALGLENIRWKFEPTHTDPLAQQPGSFTFFLDGGRRLWRGWGEKETGCPAFARSDTTAELSESWLAVERSVSLSLRCIMGEPLLEGDYSLTVLFVQPETGGTVDLELGGSEHQRAVKDHMDLRQKPVGKSGVIALAYPLKCDQGAVSLRVAPVGGGIRLCGVVIEPQFRY